ncbi:hypothetical protein ACFQ2B_28040 [Streptomyces stramineus]|uniref:Uncharacterized protein n=1 Tax=Streptomyces stramineus TaxID=173861 RepID=A0ABP3JI73_9ACTN
MSPSRLQEKAIDRDEIIALYVWAPGSCFRCARREVDSAKLGTIDTPIGDRYEIRACRSCILDLEKERQRQADRRGENYEPGQLGNNLS